MLIDKFACSQANIYRPHSNNSNWGHSTSMLHTSSEVAQWFIQPIQAPNGVCHNKDSAHGRKKVHVAISIPLAHTNTSPWLSTASPLASTQYASYYNIHPTISVRSYTTRIAQFIKPTPTKYIQAPVKTWIRWLIILAQSATNTFPVLSHATPIA